MRLDIKNIVINDRNVIKVSIYYTYPLNIHTDICYYLVLCEILPNYMQTLFFDLYATIMYPYLWPYFPLNYVLISPYFPLNFPPTN